MVGIAYYKKRHLGYTIVIYILVNLTVLKVVSFVQRYGNYLFNGITSFVNIQTKETCSIMNR